MYGVIFVIMVLRLTYEVSVERMILKNRDAVKSERILKVG